MKRIVIPISQMLSVDEISALMQELQNDLKNKFVTYEILKGDLIVTINHEDLLEDSKLIMLGMNIGISVVIARKKLKLTVKDNVPVQLAEVVVRDANRDAQYLHATCVLDVDISSQIPKGTLGKIVYCYSEHYFKVEFEVNGQTHVKTVNKSQITIGSGLCL